MTGGMAVRPPGRRSSTRGQKMSVDPQELPRNVRVRPGIEEDHRPGYFVGVVRVSSRKGWGCLDLASFR